MIAVDTNVLVRLVTNDDPKQSREAAGLFAREDVFVAKSVLLESEWVLRAAYGLSTAAIRGAFERLLSVASVTVESTPEVARAMTWYAAGMDFADALHLACSSTASSFVSFDRKFVRRAQKLDTVPPASSP